MKNLNFEQLAFEYQTTDISLTKLAKREKTTVETLSKYFKLMGVEVINKQNRPKFNIHIFDEIDTEEKAYWLGFIFADGYIGSTPIRGDKKSIYNFELSLQKSDSKHLEKFKEFISFEKDVTIDSYRCRIMVANKHFWTTLNNLGCTPRKSLTLSFPENLSEHLIKHFIRGYFDGDGCISRHIHVHTVSPNISLLGTPEFLSKIKEITNIECDFLQDKRRTEQTLAMQFNKENGIKFINYLYSDATIYLDRKYKLYNFFKNGSRSVEEFAELLQTNIGENCDVNTEIIEETKESLIS